jgi:hypothetical protein
MNSNIMDMKMSKNDVFALMVRARLEFYNVRFERKPNIITKEPYYCLLA